MTPDAQYAELWLSEMWRPVHQWRDDARAESEVVPVRATCKYCNVPYSREYLRKHIRRIHPAMVAS